MCRLLMGEHTMQTLCIDEAVGLPPCRFPLGLYNPEAPICRLYVWVGVTHMWNLSDSPSMYPTAETSSLCIPCNTVP